VLYLVTRNSRELDYFANNDASETGLSHVAWQARFVIERVQRHTCDASNCPFELWHFALVFNTDDLFA
jgi:hypothetical protein